MILLIAMPAVLLASVLAAQDDATIAPVTVKYTIGRRGYAGAESIWMAGHVPDKSLGRNDVLVGQFEKPETSRRIVRCLLRFTGLSIPTSSKILSARLRAPISQVLGKPDIAVFGLLKDFKRPDHEWQPALEGETTWNSQYHGLKPWGAPAAGKAGSRFEYDGDADHFGEADSVVRIRRQGLATFDVTRSFANELAAAKPYGWLLTEATGAAETYAAFPLRGTELVVTYVPPSAQAAPPPKPPELRLISFELGTAQRVAENLARVRQLPFQGAAFWGIDNTDERWVCNSVFGPDRIEVEHYSAFIEAGKRLAQPDSPLTDNFLRVNIVPGTLEPREGGGHYTWENRPRGQDGATMWWAEGFDAVVHNMGVAAEVARRARMKGILLDWEQYAGDVFSFGKLKDAHEQGKTIGQTRVQVRKRAELLMQAVNGVYPDMTIITIFNLYTDQTNLLWNAFVDGMVAASGPRMRLVEGNEQGYQATSTAEFQALYDWDYLEAPKFSAVPEKYLRQVEVGFGVWMDRNGWGKDPELNESSAAWQCRLESALTVADSYVWVYAVEPRWLSGNNIPQAYMNATFRAWDLVQRRRVAPGNYVQRDK